MVLIFALIAKRRFQSSLFLMDLSALIIHKEIYFGYL